MRTPHYNIQDTLICPNCVRISTVYQCVYRVCTRPLLLRVSAGFTCEEHENPADFFLDTIIHCEKERRLSSTQEETVVFSKPGQEESADISVVENCDKCGLVEKYRVSAEFQKLRKSIDPLLQSVHEESKNERTAEKVMKHVLKRELYATSFLWQVSLAREFTKAIIHTFILMHKSQTMELCL